MKSRQFKLGALGLLGAMAVAASCSKKKSSESELGDGASITISGQLAISNSSTAVSLTGDAFNATSVNPDDLSVYCVSFEVPPKAGTGDVDGEGKFSLSIEANNVSIGCFVQNGDDTLATMVFEDTESKDVDGSTKKDGRMAFSGNTDLKTIALDTATGTAVANITAIKNQVKRFEGEGGFDPSGTWTLQAADNVPEGYQTISANGDGPQDGMQVFMKRINGKKVDNGAPAYALGIWKSEAAFTSCGSKLGFKNAEAMREVGVDFGGSGLGDGPFIWAPGWTDGWKNTAAKFQYNMDKCDTYTLNGIEFNRCYGTGDAAFELSVNTSDSGCTMPDGSPAKIENWEDVTDWGSHTCSPWSKFNEIDVCTNTANYKGQTITCKHVYGTVDSNFKAKRNVFFNRTQVGTKGQSCSTSSDELAKLRCFADYYYQNRPTDRSTSNACVAEMNLNWGAGKASEFIAQGNGPVRASTQYVMNLLNYSSENSLSVRDQNEYYRGVELKTGSSENAFVNCRFIESMSLAMTKIDDNTMQVELLAESRSADSNPVCAAQSEPIERRIFKAVR